MGKVNGVCQALQIRCLEELVSVNAKDKAKSEALIAKVVRKNFIGQ